MERNLAQMHLCMTLTRLTTVRILRRKSTWFLLLVGLLPCAAGLLWIANHFIPDMRMPIKPYNMFNSIQSLYFLTFYVPMVAIFLGLGTINDEIETKNITFTLVRPLSRLSIAVGRFLGHLGAACSLLVISLTACYVANMLFQVESFIEKLPNLFNAIFIMVCGMSAYLGVVAALGTWFKKFAIMGSILWVVLDTLLAIPPVATLNGISIKYRILAGYWDALPQFMFSGTIIQSSAFVNGGICLLVAVAACGLIASRLFGREIILSDNAG